MNKKTPENSAYALLSRNREGDVERLQGDILMKESERFGERTGQHTLSTLLPMRTGEPENDREAYTMHQTLAHRMEMAIRENRAKLKNNDESERSEIPDERILIIPGLTDDETETDTPDEEAPDENASDKPLEESKK